MLRHEWLRQRDRLTRAPLDEEQDQAEDVRDEEMEAPEDEGQTTADAPEPPAEVDTTTPPDPEPAPVDADDAETSRDFAEAEEVLAVEAAEPTEESAQEPAPEPPHEPAPAAPVVDLGQEETEEAPTEPFPATEPPALPEPELEETAPPPAPDVAGQKPARKADPREVADNLEVPLRSLRDRLETVLARQAQLPLDIEARQAVSEGVEGSPRATREALVQRLLDPTLTLEETAVLLGVCRTTVRRYTDRGILRCFRTPGNQRRFSLSDVLDFMERQSRQQ